MLYFSLFITSALVIILLVIVFFEAEFRISDKQSLYKKAYALVAASSILFITLTSFLGYAELHKTTTSVTASIGESRK